MTVPQDEKRNDDLIGLEDSDTIEPEQTRSLSYLLPFRRGGFGNRSKAKTMSKKKKKKKYRKESTFNWDFS